MFTKARFVFLLASALLTYGSPAFAIKFIQNEYDWQAIVGHEFRVDLNSLVTEVDRTKPIVWSSDHLPDWAKIDASGILSGMPKKDSLSSDIFSVLAVQGTQGDEMKVFLQVVTEADLVPTHPVWLTQGVKLEGCVGQPLASGDLNLQVMLSDPGFTLPIPEIVISTIGRPDWLVEVRKEGGGYFLTGVPPAVGDTFFQARACTHTACNDIPVEVKITATCAR